MKAMREPPNTRRAASPMAATSAAMFKVLAISSSTTAAITTQAGKTALRFAARPMPVTLPIRAQIDWMTAIKG